MSARAAITGSRSGEVLFNVSQTGTSLMSLMMTRAQGISFTPLWNLADDLKQNNFKL